MMMLCFRIGRADQMLLSYTLHVKCKKALAEATRSGAGVNNIKLWKHFDQCAFLQDHVEVAAQRDSLPSSPEPLKPAEEFNQPDNIVSPQILRSTKPGNSNLDFDNFLSIFFLGSYSYTDMLVFYISYTV